MNKYLLNKKINNFPGTDSVYHISQFMWACTCVFPLLEKQMDISNGTQVFLGMQD